MSEQEIARQLQNMSRSAITDMTVSDDDVLKILRFISKVATVVDQAFEDVFATLMDVRFLTPADLLEPRKTELLKRLAGTTDHQRFKYAEDICGRLHHLSEEYAASVQPRLGSLRAEQDWTHVFALLDHHEGWIISQVSNRVFVLQEALDKAKTDDLLKLKADATAAIDEIRGALKTLGQLRNSILGLSGQAGFLELILDGHRDQVGR